MKAARGLYSLLLVFSLAGCITVIDEEQQQQDATLTIENRSRYVIFEINLSPTTSRRWGEDLLGGDVLYPDESVTVLDIVCDFYDVRVIDEDGYSCELYDVDLCFDDSVWVVSDRTLDSCPF